MKIAIIFIGTYKYKQFFDGYYEGINKNFFPHIQKTIFAFTDDINDKIFDKPNVVLKKIDHMKWPYITLYRFKFMKEIIDQLREYENVFFVDADLWAVSHIDDIPLEKELIGVQHPGFIGKIGTFETNALSKASIFDGRYDVSSYRQGCFWGGKSKDVIEMITTLDAWVDEDLSKGIVAAWHDESHMNKYFLVNSKKVYTLHAGFAQPQFGYEHVREKNATKFVHLHKDMKDFPRFEGVK